MKVSILVDMYVITNVTKSNTSEMFKHQLSNVLQSFIKFYQEKEIL